MAALAVLDSYAAGFATFTRQKMSNRHRSHHLVSGVEESLPHVVIEREWTNLSTPLGMTHPGYSLNVLPESSAQVPLTNARLASRTAFCA
jgi:hypothetical protein